MSPCKNLKSYDNPFWGFNNAVPTPRRKRKIVATWRWHTHSARTKMQNKYWPALFALLVFLKLNQPFLESYNLSQTQPSSQRHTTQPQTDSTILSQTLPTTHRLPQPLTDKPNLLQTHQTSHVFTQLLTDTPSLSHTDPTSQRRIQPLIDLPNLS
jgi:hypothetical protein